MRLKIIILTTFIFNFIYAQYLFEDDFSTNPNTNGKWRIYRYYGSSYQEGYWSGSDFYLTRNVDSRSCAAFANFDLIVTKWRAEFDLKIGGGDGADGLVFMFYKDESVYGRPKAGHTLGFESVNGKSVGYGIEFNEYRDHIAVIKDYANNHLISISDNKIDDNAFHRIVIEFIDGEITLYRDGELIIHYTISDMDYTYQGIGFCAATGGFNNNHIVDNFSLVSLEGYPNGPNKAWGFSDASMMTELVSGKFYNYSDPFFTWEPAYSDSGIAGYSVKLTLDPNDSLPNNISTTDTFMSMFVSEENKYYLRIKSKSNNNLWNKAKTLFEYYYDKTPPNDFSITAPANNAWTDATPTFEWSYVSDGFSGLDHMELYIDDQLYLDDIPTYPRSVELPDSLALKEGWHTWYMVAVDKANNKKKSNETRAFRVDDTSPASFNLISPVNNIWTADDTPRFTWQSSSDPNGSGLNEYILMIDNDIFQDQIPVDSTSIIPDNILTQGKHNWYIVAVDNVGNQRSSDQEWIVNIDTWGPGITNLNQGLLGKYYYKKGYGSNTYFGDFITSRIDPNIDFHTNDRPSGVPTSCTVRWTGELKAKTTGNYKIRVYHDDGIRLWIDNQLILNYWNDWDRGNHQTWIYLEENEWVAFKLEYYNGPLSGYVKLYWTPPGESEEIIPTEYFRTVEKDFDLLSPSDRQWVATPNPIFVWKNVIDLGIGLKNYQLYVDDKMVEDGIQDSSITISAELSFGTHTWYVQAMDSLGNVSRSEQKWSVRIDNVSPEKFQLISPKKDEIVLTPVPDFSWDPTSDQGSGLDHYELIIDEKIDRNNIPANVTTTQPSSALKEGEHYWAVLAVDKVSNIRSTDTLRFWIEYSNPPEPFSLLYPINGDTIPTDRPIFKWRASSDAGSGIKKYEIFLGNNKIGETTDTTFGEVVLENGHYNWYVRAYDGINLTTDTEVETFYVLKDTISPITKINSPSDGEVITSSQYRIQGTAQDRGGAGIDSVLISFDNGKSWHPAEITKTQKTNQISNSIRRHNLVPDSDNKKLNKEFSTEEVSWSYIWSDYSDGKFDILAKAIDKLGNEDPSPPKITVITDIKAPAVQSCLITPSAITTGKVNFVIRFIEEGTGLDPNFPPIVKFLPFNGDTLYVNQIEYNVNEKKWEGETEINFEVNEGKAVVYIDGAQDLIGHKMEIDSSYSFFIDRTPPSTFKLLQPDSGSWLNKRKPLFVWQASLDNVSGVDRYNVIVYNNDSSYVETVPSTDTSFYFEKSLADGFVKWRVEAVDKAENKTFSEWWTFNIDSTGPRINIISPKDGDTLSVGDITIKGTANDNNGIGVDSVFISFDNGNNWEKVISDSGNYAKWYYEEIVSRKGDLKILVIARDLLDNLSKDSVIVYIGNPLAIVELERLGVPDKYVLWQNYPNPFNPITTIVYGLPVADDVKIEVYNVLGKKVTTLVDGKQKAGYHKVFWEPKEAGSGVYFYVMKTRNFMEVKKMLLLR